MPGGYVLQCANCGTRNRVPHARANDKGRCAKCSTRLIASNSLAMVATDSGWAGDVIGSDAPVIVELWSPDCHVCAQYDLAVKQFPRYARVYYNRGLAYRKLDNLDQAIANYTQAIRLDPKLVAAYANRSYVYYKKGDLNRALADLDKVLELDRKNRRLKLSIKEASMDSDTKELKKYQAESETGFSDTIGDLLKEQLESFKKNLDK